jgi:hypothetical protein
MSTFVARVIGKSGAVARRRVGGEVERWRGGDDDDSDEEEEVEAMGRSALPKWRERVGAKID